MSPPDDTVTPLPTAAARTVVQGEAGHSDIFERLSANDDADDLIGLIAYGIYQRRKRAWMKDFCDTHNRFPTNEERHAYAFSYRQDAIQALRSDAESIMAAFAQGAIEERTNEMQTDALAAETHEVLTKINRRITEIGGYWHHIVGHLVGFGALAGLVFAVTLIVRYEPTLDKLQEAQSNGVTLLLLILVLLVLGWIARLAGVNFWRQTANN